MTLGDRLRELRRTALPRTVRQSELAAALGVQNTTVSTWEGNSRVPPGERLRDIATFFATARSLEADRLLSDSDLGTDERAKRDSILDELTALRGRTPGTSRNPWHFPDGAPVRIVCGALDKADRPRFASGRNHNYMAMSAFADQDALVELFGHVRAENPDSDVRFELARRLEADDMQTHLVILGNLGWLEGSALSLPRLRLPVRIVPGVVPDGEIFEAVDGTRYQPALADPDDPDSPVVEDVALFWRAQNPMNRRRTLTVCSGVFTRGVYAAVRMFSDRQTSDDNISYLDERFPGAEKFGVLARTQVLDHATTTPNLRDDATRLAEFPPRGS